MVYDTIPVERVFKHKIEKVRPWIPPFKATTRKPAARIVTKIPSDPQYRPCTLEEALKVVRKPSYKELMQDLYMSPSPSITPSSSAGTICLDENNYQETSDFYPCRVDRVYRRFKQSEQDY
ncbi:MAG: hypothetical protein AB2693_34040 [Candidatus Thiodiazotropha sp.]